MRMEMAEAIRGVEFLSGTRLIAFPQIPRMPFEVRTRTVDQKFGFFGNDAEVSEQAFCDGWNDPLNVLNAEILRSYYKRHRLFLENSLKQNFPFYNGLSARLLTVEITNGALPTLELELGTTSFWSYAASNFLKRTNAYGIEHSESGHLDLRMSRLANLCGIHCLIFNDTTVFMVRRGATALFPKSISSSVNGGLSATDSNLAYDLPGSILTEISQEANIAASVHDLRWLGVGLTNEFHQPAIYCTLHTNQSTEEILSSFTKASHAFEIERNNKRRLATPEILRLNVRTAVKLYPISVGPWSLSIPVALSIQNLERKAKQLIQSKGVHPHAKALLALFCMQVLGSKQLQRLLDS